MLCPDDGGDCPMSKMFESSGGPTVTRKQCNAWSDRMTSEMEVVGHVPAWLIVEMLREAGVKVES